MSTAVSGAPPKPAPSAAPPASHAAPSRVRRFIGSAIGLKIVMAATGIALSLFVLVHMAGNLQVFLGAEAMDAYGAALKKYPPVLWGARIGLVAMAAAHVAAFIALTKRSRAARPVGYRKTAHRESTFASRSMRLTGPLLLAFIVYHLLHFTTGTVHPDFHEGKVYANLVTGLRVVPVALFYLLAMACLGLHLFHGVWSLFQTLGSSQPRAASFARKLATVFTIVVVAGFAAIPLAVLAGILK